MSWIDEKRAWLLALVGGCIFALGTHVAGLADNYNDKAGHRAAAYYYLVADAAERTSLRATLADCFGTEAEQPAGRMDMAMVYPLTHRLTLMVEGALPSLTSRTAYGPVFVSHGIAYVLVLALSFFALRACGSRGVELFGGILVGFLPWITEASMMLPFANEFFSQVSYHTTYPRGPALLGAFVAAMVMGFRGATPRVRFGFGAALLAVALSLHVVTAVLVFGVGVAAVFVWPFVADRARARGLHALDLSTFRVARFFAVVVVLFVVKFAIQVALGARAHTSVGALYGSRLMMVFIVVSVVFAAYYFWATSMLVPRVLARFPDDDAVANVTRYLLLTATVAIAMYPAMSTTIDTSERSILLLGELARRFVGFAHAGFYVLVALLVQSELARRGFAARAFPLAMAIVLPLTGAANAYRAFHGLDPDSGVRYPLSHIVTDPTNATIHLDDLCTDGTPIGEVPMHRAFHALANEIRDAHR